MTTEEKLFKTYEKELNEFEDWISLHPRLPKKINKLLLLRFLKVCDFDIEAAKKLYVLYLETRKKNPNLFEKRDVLSDSFQKTMSTFQIVGLKKLTKENHKITVFRLSTKDATFFSYVDQIRLITAMMDCRLVYCDENELINGEVSVIDLSNFTFTHFRKILPHFGTMKAYLAFAQEAQPVKIIQTHYINCPYIMSKLMAMMMPFFRAEVRESMIVHSSLESLYEYIPKDMLPEDFGGTCENLEESYGLICKYIENKRDYILNDDNWKIED